MLELLVASLCIGGFRCDEATKAYLVYNPQPKAWVDSQGKYVQNKAVEYVGEQTLIGIGTAAAIATHRTFQVRINKYFSIGRTAQGVELLLGANF